MAKALIKVNVAYPHAFKETFEKQGRDRTAEGAGSFIIALDDDVYNNVYIIVDWDSINSSRRFWASPKGKTHITEWGSVSDPDFVFLRGSLNH